MLNSNKTSKWFSNIEMEFPYNRISIIPQGKHVLPKDISLLVKESWDNVVRDRKVNLLKQFNEEDIIEEDSDGLTALYVIENGVKRARLFAGPMTRLNNYDVIKEKTGNHLRLEFGKTNYAELMTTNNRDPFGILQDYGRKGLANPVNISVVVSIKNGDDDELFTFDRGFGLGEYPSKGDSREERLEICVAGGIDTQYTHPHDATYKELYEETGILPNLGDQEWNYKNKGIVPLNSKILFGDLSNRKKIALITDNSGEYKPKFLFDETPESNMICLGMITNVDPYDKNTEGKTIPHFRPELIYYVETDLQRDELEGLWVRSQEHLRTNYIPFSEDSLGQYSLERYLNMLSTGHAAFLFAGKRKFGEGWFNDMLKQTNKKYPIESNHPFYSRIESGEIDIH